MLVETHAVARVTPRSAPPVWPELLDFRRTIDIERLLIWTFRDQKAHIVIGRGEGLSDQEAAQDGVEIRRSSTCGIAAIERLGLLGVRVDGGGPSAGHLHEDAEAVHRVVMALGRGLAGLLVRHAVDADRPDWMPGAVPRPVAKYRPNGRVVISYNREDRGRDYGWCPIEWTLSQVRIDAARLAYATWRHAIAGLVRQLPNLHAFIALAPSAPIDPWKNGGN